MRTISPPMFIITIGSARYEAVQTAIAKILCPQSFFKRKNNEPSVRPPRRLPPEVAYVISIIL